MNIQDTGDEYDEYSFEYEKALREWKRNKQAPLEPNPHDEYVDRREHPNAIPLQEYLLLNTPKPQPTHPTGEVK